MPLPTFQQRVAILIDGGFFQKRYPVLYGGGRPPEQAANDMWRMAVRHARRERDFLYRIFYYDCPPLDKKAHYPISKTSIDFQKTPLAIWKNAFMEELKRKRKVALRLGHIRADGHWKLHPEATKDLLAGKRKVEDLTDNDVQYEMTQKGVDMKIGLDISSLAYKRQVEKIVLVSGDSDFVPAAKLARREGIDFILDPMWNPINTDLFEHIDGLHSTSPKPPPPAAPIPPSAAPPAP